MTAVLTEAMDAAPSLGGTPTRAFQILITSRHVSQKDFSPTLRLNQQSLRVAYPDLHHHLYGNDEIRALLADDFEPDVLAAYDALVPFAYKADLARYCLLHHYGGLYSDLSYLHVQPLALSPDKSLILFHDLTDIHPAGAISNGLILARKGHPLLETAIRQIVAHHKAGFLGNHPLDPTGPYMLGRLVEAYPKDGSILLGTSHLINRDHKRRANIVKLLPNGELISLRNKGLNSSIEELVPDGGNIYGDLWRKGLVWDSAPIIPSRRSPFARLHAWARRRFG